MSRKTRKLIWSAPLVAVLALAMFVALAPDQVAAHDAAPPVTTSHLPPGPSTGVTVITPSAMEGGRTSLRVSWNAPTTGDPAMTYRIDMSTDSSVWHNVTRSLSSDDAEAACTASDSGNRCFVAGNPDRKDDGALMPDTEYHFRVFSYNADGTSGISILRSFGTGTTLPIVAPATVEGLMASNTFHSKIELTWNELEDDGGADIKWYCINVTSPNGPVTDLAATESLGDCREIAADTETTETVDMTTLLDTVLTNDDAQTIVIAATEEDDDGNVQAVTSYTHDELTSPDVIRLKYQVWVVTDDGSEADNRRISLAASNFDEGSTIRDPSKPDPTFEQPRAPQNLRIVAFTADLADATNEPEDDGQVHLYWNLPANFPDAPDTWDFRVERIVEELDADGDRTGKTIWTTVVGEATPALPSVFPGLANYAVPQFSVDMDAAGADPRPNDDPPVARVYPAPDVIGDGADSGRFRVLYINKGKDDVPDVEDQTLTQGHQNTNTDDDMDGQPAEKTISLPLTAADFINTTTLSSSTLPIITKEGANGADHTDLSADDEGLRFTRNPSDPRNRIDLRWMQDPNANMVGTDPNIETVRTQTAPNGYVIDRAIYAEDGTTLVGWKSLFRADENYARNLASDIRYTDARDVKPGARYTYRVFPTFIASGYEYGVPAMIDASSEQADLPDRVQGLMVAPTEDDDGNQSTSSLTLTWNALPESQNGGHPIEGYLVQVSVDHGQQPAIGHHSGVDQP